MKVAIVSYPPGLVPLLKSSLLMLFMRQRCKYSVAFSRIRSRLRSRYELSLPQQFVLHLLFSAASLPTQISAHQ